MAGPRAARRLAAAALLGGGGLGVVGGSLVGLLKVEASRARRVINMTPDRPPSPDGVYGADLDGDPVRLLLLGDSTGVGYGMTRAGDTPLALFAHGLSQLAERPVDARSCAQVGARSQDLDAQLDTYLAAGHLVPDVVAVVVGANDVVKGVRLADAVRAVDALVRRVRELGAGVVVGTCPDLGTVRPLAPPLRQLARSASRRLAAAQTITVVEAGGRSVSLADLLGRDFYQAPEEMFGADRFHPSFTGYASMVAAMLPSVAICVGAWDDDEDAAAYTEGTVLPVSFAAARAARAAGTEVAGTAVTGEVRGPRGRWAHLRRHRTQDAPPPDR